MNLSVPVETAPRADIIVPVYNERASLPLLWQRLQALPSADGYHFIFVDNASCDGSWEFIQQLPGVTAVRHSQNYGYGRSLRSGYARCVTDHCAVIDADCEYPPECLPELLAALEKHNVVYASRLLGRRGAAACGMPWLKWLGNQLISQGFNHLFQQQLTDLYTGCKAFRLRTIHNQSFERDGFEHVLEFAASLAARGYRIAELPVVFAPRAAGRSKMLHVRETLKFIYWLLRYRFGEAQQVKRRGSAVD